MTKTGKNLTLTAICPLFLLAFAPFAWTQQPQAAMSSKKPPIEEKTAGMQKAEGFFPFYWDADAGKIWLEIARFDEDFLYVASLATGLGSNPVGLDRTQIGDGNVVRFQRVGPRVLLVQPNLRYRAVTDNPHERRAVEESFAQSVHWGAEIAAETDGRVLVDATDFILRDAVNVVRRLESAGQGAFSLDKTRSAPYLERTKAFPDNTEFEATLTFSSTRPGRLVAEVTPSADAVTIRQHQSFVRLPDSGYQPRRFDPRAPSYGITFSDYSSPLDQALEQRWIGRHRLRKKDPSAERSEAVEPIVYYLDPGAPEPVRSALLEGARWWNQAFEAAGYQDAFRVELLPEGADPLDVRYNVIQWVHRSTRGWSYGSSVLDPRTGEIIKGHVLLGSLRVRQDRMIFEGLHPIFNASDAFGSCDMGGGAEAEYLAAADPNLRPVDVALARIRQLSAHEVGHTLGFAHNFAASVNDRASVMDYPAPLAKVGDDGALDLSDAYGVGIGNWDKVAVRYAYSDFPPEVNEKEALDQIVEEAVQAGLLFIADRDARPTGAAHPLANLWDNGTDTVQALRDIMNVRRAALSRFGEKNISLGQPMADLENTLVPLYLHHRYQTEATAKMLGGVFYSYKLRGDSLQPQQPVSPESQRAALAALLATIAPKELTIPSNLAQMLYPLPFGYSDTRERFPSKASPIFDPLSAAATAADISLSALLQHERAARLEAFHAQDGQSPGLSEVLDRVLEAVWQPSVGSDQEAAVARVVQDTAVTRLIDLAGNQDAAPSVRAVASAKLRELAEELETVNLGDERDEWHAEELLRKIEAFLSRPHPPATEPKPPEAPPGSPIG